MPRFILFSGDDPPLGGARDVAGGYNDLATAIDAGEASGREWWNILDAHTGEFFYAAEAPEPDPDAFPDFGRRKAEAAERQRIALAEKVRTAEFGERFDEVTNDARAAANRSCKLRGHQPMREQPPARKGAKALVACACGSRLYERTEGGYSRVLTSEMITRKKRGKR